MSDTAHFSVGVALPTSDLDVVVLNLPFVAGTRDGGAVRQLQQIRMAILRCGIGAIKEVRAVGSGTVCGSSLSAEILMELLSAAVFMFRRC